MPISDFFEVLTAYTPVHSYTSTLMYRVEVNPKVWQGFFERDNNEEFKSRFEPAGFEVDTRNEKGLIDFQLKLKAGDGPYFLK